LQAVPLPEQGLLLTTYLAEMLDLRVGDLVDVEVLEGRRETLRLPLAATVTEYLGVGAYARREWVNRLLQEGDVVTGAWLKVAATDKPAVLATLRQRPRVAAVTDRNASVASFRDTMAQSMLTFTLVATLMAASMAGGVVYNAARITLAERARDLASLRILGYTQAEVRGLLMGELATLTLLALLPGFALGYGMSALLVWGMQSELYRVPLVVLPSGLALAGAVLLGAAALSAWLVLGRLRRLDLVAVLKTRE
jgi:putative ABC transport system permease protein